MFNGGAILPFDFVLSNELLVTIGTDALDWLAGGRPSVAFDWLLGTPNELLLVAAKLVDPNVTVNVFESDLDPWVAITGASPIDDVEGTVKLAKNAPLLLGFNGDGVVVTEVPLNDMTTVVVGSNPIPVMFTDVPTDPGFGSSWWVPKEM